MSDSSSWSLPFGRPFGIQVRVHALFMCVAVFALFLSTRGQTPAAGYGILSVAVLFASVLLHELGHCWAAARVGGTPERIVIGPLGGGSLPDVPREFQPELVTALAGPLVNLGILLLALPLLAANQLSLASLVNPLQPTGLIDGTWWEVTLKLTFWANWVLLLVNLLPAFPFDGGYVLRTLLWPAIDYRTASVAATRISKLTAVGLCVLAWVLRDAQSAEALATWVPLVLLATFVYFSAQQEAARLDASQWDEELFSYDFSHGYTSLERAEPQRPRGSSLARWLESRRELRRRRRQWQEQEEERQVDDILMRLHAGGMQSLSAKERAILDRVSARYRNRQRS